jgi:AraC family transcriptional regulator
LAKIAVEFARAKARRAAIAAESDRPAGSVLARGEGWTVTHLICTAGPQNRPFEEQHSQVSIAIVVAGTFQYRASDGCRRGELMTPGSLLLGNAGERFECGHEHGVGDRCLSFSYAPDYFEEIAGDLGTAHDGRRFRIHRLPALRALSRLTAQACAGLEKYSAQKDLTEDVSWEQLGIQLAASAMHLANGAPQEVPEPLPSVVARVTRAARMIEENQASENQESELTIRNLARRARLSPYHFLRSFRQIMRLTPHQYVLRVRLRNAAIRLVTCRAKVLDIALDCGFGDVSNFNRAFRKEFGMCPQRFRQQGVESAIGSVHFP